MNPLLVQGAAQLLLSRYKSTTGMFMKNMLTMAATGLVIFALLGWYLDWYKVSRTTTPDGKQHISIDVNTQRIRTDVKSGEQKIGSYLGQTVGFPSTTVPPLAAPGQPNQPYFPPQSPPNTYPPQGTAYPPGYQQPGYPPGYQQPQQYPPGYQPQPAYQPPAPNGWLPAQPTSRPNTGGTFQPIPGRPF